MNPAGWDLDATVRWLEGQARHRLDEAEIPVGADQVVFPFGIFWLRGDHRGPGGALAEQMQASFDYWHKDSGDAVDVVWPGWLAGWEEPHFEIEAFFRYRHQVESKTQWQYGGHAELVILTFDFWPNEQQGSIDWTRAVSLPVEKLIADGRISSLDSFMHALVAHSRELSSSSPTWELSARFAQDQAARTFWEWLTQRFGFAGQVVDDVLPYRQVDLSQRGRSPSRRRGT